jgi:hypothetical protein
MHCKQVDTMNGAPSRGPSSTCLICRTTTIDKDGSPFIPPVMVRLSDASLFLIMACDNPLFASAMRNGLQTLTQKVTSTRTDGPWLTQSPFGHLPCLYAGSYYHFTKLSVWKAPTADTHPRTTSSLQSPSEPALGICLLYGENWTG